jgi:hypothetical protein
MKHSSRLRRLAAALFGLTLLAPVAADAQFGSTLARVQREQAQRQAAERGFFGQFVLPPAEALRQSRILHRALEALPAQRPGTVDAYVLSIGMDSDPVFGREAAEASRVLARRYDAQGRTVLLTNGDGAADTSVPLASPDHIAAAIARIAEVMDRREDVLVFYVTTHGHWVTGLNWRDGERGRGDIGPGRLAAMLESAGITNRLMILSACYSGVFVPALASDTTLVITAASASKPSFGCRAENDWTFFGDALINTALRKPVATEAAFREAGSLVGRWEREGGLDPSDPQISVGRRVSSWLAPLERRMPADATQPTGRPSAAPPATR